jgi:hypothetical protein
MHKDTCIRSDGEVFCGYGCTHDRDAYEAEVRAQLAAATSENERMRRALESALDLLERVPQAARDAARSKGNNSVLFELHALITPFVDTTRAALSHPPAAETKEPTDG